MPVTRHRGGKRIAGGYLARRRAKLIASLGGKCARCGSTEKLVLDHLKPKEWQPNAISKSRRLRTQARDARRGKVQVLCATCHGAKTRQENSWLADFVPF